VETMVAIGRTVAFQRLEHEPVTAEQVKERVAPEHLLMTEYAAKHAIEFESPYTGRLVTDFLCRR